MKYLLTLLVLSAIVAVGLMVKDQPTLSDRITENVNLCLNTVGFWPCSTRHINIVKEKVCPVKSP